MNTQYLDSWIFNWHVFFCSKHVLHLLLGCFLIQNAHLNQEKTHIYPDGRVFTGVFPDISGSIHGKTMSGFLASKRFKTHKVQKCQEWVQVRSSNLDITCSKSLHISNEHLHACIIYVTKYRPSGGHLAPSPLLGVHAKCHKAKLMVDYLNNFSRIVQYLLHSYPAKQYIKYRVRFAS